MLVHSVLWPLALSISAGFQAVPATLRMADKVFAGLALVILIGLLVENILFRNIERLSVRHWGMQS